MAFIIRIPYEVATHGKIFTALSQITGKSKMFGFGRVGNSLYFHNGVTQKQVGTYTPVALTAANLTVTQALHANRVVAINIAAGTAITLPAATGTGDQYTFIVLTTFTGDATIKAASSADSFIGTATLYQDAGDTVVGFATANTGTLATETDTLDMFDTGNVTGGIKGARAVFTDVASAIWHVDYISDAAGTEATPFKVTV